MKYRNNIVLMVLLVATAVAGCTQSRDDSVLNALTTRLERLEQRVALTEKRSELTVLTQRLSNIEARVAAVEAKSTVAERHDPTTTPENVDRPAGSDSAAASPSDRVEAASERSRRVKSVAEEDRARVATIREQSRNNPDPAARRQAMSELRAWRRAQAGALRSRDNASGETK
jgi:hypothetical protein